MNHFCKGFAKKTYINKDIAKSPVIHYEIVWDLADGLYYRHQAELRSALWRPNKLLNMKSITRSDNYLCKSIEK